MNKGRYIKFDVIQTSHRRTAANFFSIKDMPGVKEVSMYDNSGKEPRLTYSRNADGEHSYDNEFLRKYEKKSRG